MVQGSVRCVLIAFILLGVCAQPGWAACGAGKTPTYGDVKFIEYERWGCHFAPCQSYRVMFSAGTLYKETFELTYEGGRYVQRRAAYVATNAGELKRATKVLEGSDFYNLNVSEAGQLTLDASRVVLATERCGVDTSLAWVESSPYRSDIEAAFSALNAVADQVHWRHVRKIGPDIWWLLSPR